MITLLTDFGTSDYFVAAMKGVILSLAPNVQIIDLTHDIPPHDIHFAAFTLDACYRNFPKNTVHLAVVDPGVGSNRRILILKAGDYYFVGPDNGIFSYIYSNESDIKVIDAINTNFYKEAVCATFAGRDIFAPIAANLVRGFSPESFGNEINDYVKFDILKPCVNRENNSVNAHIVHTDRFGNCITNLIASDLPKNKRVKIYIKDKIITNIYTHYAQADNESDLISYIGSTGRIEIAIKNGSAEKAANIKRNDELLVKAEE